MRSLRTKPDNQTRTYTVQYGITIYEDQNFRLKMHLRKNVKNWTKSVQNVYYVHPPLLKT